MASTAISRHRSTSMDKNLSGVNRPGRSSRGNNASASQEIKLMQHHAGRTPASATNTAANASRSESADPPRAVHLRHQVALRYVHAMQELLRCHSCTGALQDVLRCLFHHLIRQGRVLPPVHVVMLAGRCRVGGRRLWRRARRVSISLLTRGRRIRTVTGFLCGGGTVGVWRGCGTVCSEVGVHHPSRFDDRLQSHPRDRRLAARRLVARVHGRVRLRDSVIVLIDVALQHQIPPGSNHCKHAKPVIPAPQHRHAAERSMSQCRA